MSLSTFIISDTAMSLSPQTLESLAIQCALRNSVNRSHVSHVPSLRREWDTLSNMMGNYWVEEDSIGATWKDGGEEVAADSDVMAGLKQSWSAEKGISFSVKKKYGKMIWILECGKKEECVFMLKSFCGRYNEEDHFVSEIFCNLEFKGDTKVKETIAGKTTWILKCSRTLKLEKGSILVMKHNCSFDVEGRKMVATRILKAKRLRRSKRIVGGVKEK